MMRKNSLLTLGMLVAGAVAVGFAVTMGCQSSTESSSASATTKPSAPLGGLFGRKPDRSGTELWADNCTRCHNARPPEYYSDAQWDLIVHHMRLRADLTGEESRKVVEFLKAAN